MQQIKKAAPSGNGSNSQTKGTKKNPYRKPEAVKMLEAIANDEARKRNPNTPPEWLAPRKYRDDNANGLTKCIIDFLKFHGHQAERINNTGRMLDNRKTFTDVVGNRRQIGATKWIPGTGTKGTADIAATVAGRSVKIEVKIGADRQSQAQQEYQKQVEAAGGIYIIARNFEGFYDWYIQTISA